MSVALVIQHAMGMHHIILSSVACLALLSFPHYLINGMIKKNEHEMCLLTFSTTFV